MGSVNMITSQLIITCITVLRPLPHVTRSSFFAKLTQTKAMDFL